MSAHSRFSEGLAGASAGDTFGYIDTTGSFVIPSQFVDCLPFSEGLAAVLVGDRWGYVDRSGHMVIPADYLLAHTFHNGVAIVECDGRTGLERLGDAVVATDTELATRSLVIDRSGTVRAELGDMDAMDIVVFRRKGNKTQGFQVFDGMGNLLCADRYEYVRPFAEGIAPVKQDGRWGFIDTLGNTIVLPKYDGVEAFAGGVAMVRVGPEWRWIRRDGTEIVDR